jgi:hypothetical protein
VGTKTAVKNIQPLYIGGPGKPRVEFYLNVAEDGKYLMIGETEDSAKRLQEHNKKGSRKWEQLSVISAPKKDLENLYKRKKQNFDTELVKYLQEWSDLFKEGKWNGSEEWSFNAPANKEEAVKEFSERLKECFGFKERLREVVTLRDEQQACKELILQACKRWEKNPNDKNARFLVACIMRFGKTLTVLSAFQESEKYSFGLWVSATPAVHPQVVKEVGKYYRFRHARCINQKEFSELSLEDLEEIFEKLKRRDSKKVVVVLSLQYLSDAGCVEDCSEEEPSSKAEKIKYITELPKFLMVDECDFGTRSLEHSKIIKALDTKDSFRVEMTGTPFRVLGDFLSENTFSFSYYEEQLLKSEDSEKYRDKVTIQLYAINLFDTLKNQSKFWDEDGSFNIRRFFENASNADWFVEQQFKYFDETEHNNQTRHYSLLDLYKGQVCVRDTHLLLFCPSRKAAKNLAAALQKNRYAKRYYAVLNVSSGECSNDAAKTSEEVERHINNAEADNKKAIVLSVGKLKRGNTLKKIDTAVMLDNGESYENWFQAVCRAKSYRDGKDFCFIVDFNPTRTFVMMWQFAESVAKSQNLNLDKELFEQIIGSTFNPYIYGEYGIKQRRLSFEDAFKEAKSIDRVLRNINKFRVDTSNLVSSGDAGIIDGITNTGKKDTKLVESLAQIAKGNSGQSVRRNTEASAKEQDKQEKEQQALIEKIQSILNNLPRVLAIYPEITSLKGFYKILPEITTKYFHGIDEGFSKRRFNQNDLQDRIDGFRLATTDLSRLEVLSTINRYHVSKDQIPTPFVLVKQMVDKLFNYATITIDTTFCDPYTKSGEYLAYLCERLMKNPEHVERFPNEEKRKQHILNKQLFGFSHDLPSLETTNHFLYGDRKFDGNVKLVSLEELQQMTKQFDMVVGNPPYQDGTKAIEGKKKGTIGGDLWSKFVPASLKICKSNGFIAMVHPNAWRKPEHKLWELMSKENQLHYLEIHSKKDGQKTFGCSTRYDWYVLEKSLCEKPTMVVDEEGKQHNIDMSKRDFLPNYEIELFDTCLAKRGEEKCEVMYSRSAYGTDKKHMSKEKDELFKYPVVHGLRKNDDVSIWYSSRNDKGHFGVPKVILSWGEFQYPMLDFEGKYGMTQIVFGIAISSREEGENIVKAINSEKFKKVIACSKWSAFQTEWRMFKYFRKDFWRDFV